MANWVMDIVRNLFDKKNRLFETNQKLTVCCEQPNIIEANQNSEVYFVTEGGSEICETLEVYCDNENLKEKIVKANPSELGLYPHEIIMIFYASMGAFKTKETEIPNIFKYQLYVKLPILLLQSLVKRGFLRICDDVELINYLDVEMLNKLMKIKELKCVGKRSTDNMRSVLLENYTTDELKDIIQFGYYIPTVKGNQAIQDRDVWNNRYNIWKINNNCNDKGKISKIKVINIDEFEFRIDKNKEMYEISVGEVRVSIKDKCYYMDRDKLTLIINNQKIKTFNDVWMIDCLSKSRQLIIAEKKAENEYYFYLYDINTGMKIIEEKRDSLQLGLIDNSYYNPYGLSTEAIMEEDKIIYFVSIQSEKARIILENYFKDRILFESIENIFEDDPVINYKIKVDFADDYVKNFIMYMIINKLLDMPKIRGISISNIIWGIRKNELTLLDRSATNKFNDYYHYDEAIINEVSQKLGCCAKEVVKKLENTYPKQVLFADRFDHYSSNTWLIDKNWEEVKNHTAYWAREFNNVITELKLKGILPVKWINEFSLFTIARRTYEDAIYQYKSDWLGLQSLDIFIPSINLAIEYQGVQHYEAVNVFGGKEEFEHRKILDENKRKLCKENGISLFEWKYDVEVNEKNFRKLVKTNFK